MKKALLLFMSILSFVLTSCGGSQDDPTIKLNKNSLDLKVGEIETLHVSFTPDNLENLHLVWTVDSAIATIDAGVVTALAKGITDIKVFLDLNSNLFYDASEPFAVCVLTVSERQVSPIAVTSVTLNETSLTLNLNDEITLAATVLPTNATEKTITWVSDNTTVAAVSGGKVIANSVGSAIITAYVDENLNAQKDANEKYATCSVIVAGNTPNQTIWVNSVAINPSSIALTEDSFEMISATVLPRNATHKSVTWLSSNSVIATVAAGKVSGIKAGVATITAYVDENGNAALDGSEKHDTITITVTAKSVDPKPDEGAEPDENPNPSEDSIPAREENLPIGNTSLSGPSNTTPVDISNWVNYDFSSSLPLHWSFIMGNNKVHNNSNFYAESSGGGFQFAKTYYGLQSPLLNSWLKTEVRLTVSQVNNNNQKANENKNKPIFHIYSYDSDGYYLGMQTYEQQSTFANIQEIKFYIANPNMAYFEIRLNAYPCKGQQCYNFGVSQISVKGWPYGI